MAATKNYSSSRSTGGSRGGLSSRCCSRRGLFVVVVLLLPASTSAAAPQKAPAVPLPPRPFRAISLRPPCKAPQPRPSSFLEDVYGNMSRHGKSPKLDLRLNLSAPRGGPSGVAGGSAGNNSNNHNRNHNNNSPHHSSSSSSPTSPPSSCVSSETEQGRCSSSPEATSMVLVGCPRCLMYVMLSEDDPKCPKCKSTVLLDFLNDPKNAPATSTKARKK